MHLHWLYWSMGVIAAGGTLIYVIDRYTNTSIHDMAYSFFSLMSDFQDFCWGIHDRFDRPKFPK